MNKYTKRIWKRENNLVNLEFFNNAVLFKAGESTETKAQEVDLRGHLI